MGVMGQLGTLPDRASEPRAPAACQVSVIVLVNERAESLDELYEEYSAPLRAGGVDCEFVFVAQPYFSHALEPVRALARRGASIRAVELAQASGEATLVKAGASVARGAILVTLPSYRRVEASALPTLIAQVEAGVDLALARRWPRRDSWVNRAQNRVLHALLGRLSGERLEDVACGVRAMRRELVDQITVYGDFYRFLPLFALREGYRVAESPFPQHPEDRGRRIYAPGVYLRRLIDILGLYFLLRFTDKPLRFFGLVGSAVALAGGFLLVVLAAQRLAGRGIADRPLLLLGVMLVVLGTQAIALGLIGEIIVHLHAPNRRGYRLRGSPVATNRPAPNDDGSNET
jgi:hypothetical protein